MVLFFSRVFNFLYGNFINRISIKIASVASSILIVDDLEDVRWILSNIVTKNGMRVIEAADGEAALKIIRDSPPDLVLLDVGLPDIDGFEVLKRLKAIDRSIPVIMITGNGNTMDAVRAIHAGAFDYVVKPFSNQDIVLTLRNALIGIDARRHVLQVLQPAFSPGLLVDQMGSSSAVMEIQADVERVAKTNFSVMVTGESGTGKELVSQAIHALSLRCNQPFVALDCGSIPDTLIESELFGHEKGAFTGAHQAKAGAFELAAGGTIFLDEIGNLPLSAQGKLLRVLETRRIHRIGSSKTLEVDFRVVAATNADLLAMVKMQTFRGDLYHRIAEYTIFIPSLQSRSDDLNYLVTRFLSMTNQELGKQIQGLNQAAWNLIHHYSWPGNARELRNQLRRAVLMCDDDDGIISPKHLGMIGGLEAALVAAETSSDEQSWFNEALGNVKTLFSSAAELLEHGSDLPLKELTTLVNAQMERAIIIQVLRQTRCNKAKAARMLHIDYKTLLKKLKDHSISTLQVMQDTSL